MDLFLDGRTDHQGRITANTYNADGSVASTTVTVGDKVLTTAIAYDAMGRRSVVTRPDGKQVRYDYWPTGENRKVEGAGTYTASYAYTDQGRLQTLTTAAGDTHWEYDIAGNLARKVYLDGTDVDYAYTPGGKLLQRTTERGIVTLYQYNSAGQLERVDYSDDKTAPVVYGYNRLGQNSSVVNGDSTTINEYNADGALLRQSISGGPLDGITLEQSFDDQGQREQFTASLPHNQSIAHHYAYDDKGRMQTVRQDDRQATYVYDDETGALTTTRFETAGEPIAETTREFDDLGRLTNISTRSIKEGGDFYQSFDYTYNATHQRTRVAMEDGSYWEYQYDDLGQVISARKYWRDGKPVAGQQFEYAFDGIGNRETAKYGGDAKGGNLSEITYTKGEKDPTQIGNIEHPGITYVTGKANESAEVEVTAVSATAQPEIDRQGEYFSAPVTIDNSNGASVETITIAAREGDQSDETSRRAFIPAHQTQHLYDPDGNLLYDGRWHYEWDGENRLITMRAATEATRGLRSMELQFAYDHIGRRISKRVVETIEGKPVVASDQHFVYDGWNLVAELDTTGRAFRTHQWGLDLSGSTQGAGGIGGLLSTATNERAVYVSYDGNGNVTGELDARTGTVTATASYDAFGNVITREFESATPFGFSTKFMDGESGFLYYGFRCYDSANGKWLSRDPIAEAGGIPLYGMVGNNLVNKWDFLGKVDYDAIATVKRSVGNPFGTYGSITIRATGLASFPEFIASTLELPYGRYSAGGESGVTNFPLRTSATGYLRRSTGLASSKAESADDSVPARVLDKPPSAPWGGPGASGLNPELSDIALNSSLWQGQGSVYVHAGMYPTHSTFCIVVGTDYIRGVHTLSPFPQMSEWPANRDAAAGTLPAAMAAVASQHPGTDPTQFVWDEFEKADSLRTQFDMNYWIASLECRLRKRGASKQHEEEPIMKIRVEIDASALRYDSTLVVYPNP